MQYKLAVLITDAINSSLKDYLVTPEEICGMKPTPKVSIHGHHIGPRSRSFPPLALHFGNKTILVRITSARDDENDIDLYMRLKSGKDFDALSISVQVVTW